MSGIGMSRELSIITKLLVMTITLSADNIPWGVEGSISVNVTEAEVNKPLVLSVNHNLQQQVRYSLLQFPNETLSVSCFLEN
jgi:hypothetical protein